MRAERIPSTIPFPSGPPRTPGIHASKVIRAMAAQYGILDKSWVTDLSLVEVRANEEAWWDSLDETSRIRMAMGLAWEQWYLPRIEGVVYQPGEMELDGIYMTPDGESLSTILTQRGPRLVLAVHEVKVTWKSVNTVGDLQDEWMWLMQNKSYCKAKGSLLSFLHILYPCGDYMKPIRPQNHVWRIEYEPQETGEAWDKIREYVSDRRASEVIPAHIRTNRGGLIIP